MRSITALGLTMNVEVSPDQVRAVADALTAQGWTAEQVADDLRVILGDADLLAMVRRAGAITPEPFVELKKRQTVLGPCFTFGCRTPATVAAWGDVYCRPCYERHRQQQRARDYARYRESPEFCRKPEDFEETQAAPLLDMLSGKAR